MDRSDDEFPKTHRVDPDRSVSEAVVYAVSEATGTDPLDLEPLYTAVDPDCLDELFARADSARPAELRFTFSGYEMTVISDGRVRIEGDAED
ncbi:hypothetical protein BRC81_08175 [Halobacteriales archaeon QS_1_68_20]|nr:MAG: hypothetical protein BRC81_08175 [Halobacteriales archaeon QS_1_68_20]